MNSRDPHPAGSLDRRLFAHALRLDSHTAPALYGARGVPRLVYRPGTRPSLESWLSEHLGGVRSPAPRVERIARELGRLAKRHSPPVGRRHFGGTEEQILARGTDWCTDLARVGCALFQVAGFPARLAYLADLQQPYSGHAIVEVFWGMERSVRWGAVDVVDGRVYRRPDGGPASVWDLTRHPEWLRCNLQGAPNRVERAGQFSVAAMASFRLTGRPRGSSPVVRVNAYYRTILRKSERGWPGGLRWLFGEDRDRQ